MIAINITISGIIGSYFPGIHRVIFLSLSYISVENNFIDLLMTTSKMDKEVLGIIINYYFIYIFMV